jgi:glutathione S-transferase
MSQIILHHYPQSPFSEKVRAVFGYKKLAWRSVVIPRILPKPDLVALTGGYRRTPVMQIGADVYCDTQCILREIEHRFPAPTLYPEGSEGLADALTFWADRALFWAAVGVAFAERARRNEVPEAFFADRSKFTGRDMSVEKLIAAEPAQKGQVRAQLTWLESMLRDGRPYLLGDAPSLADFAVYNPIWFLRQHLGALPEMLAPFSRLGEWADRMRGYGNGSPEELSAQDALGVARASNLSSPEDVDPSDPVGLKCGAAVTVCPDDTGRDPVSGSLVSSSVHEVVLRRSDPAAGQVLVHFPRAGFVVSPS